MKTLLFFFLIMFLGCSKQLDEEMLQSEPASAKIDNAAEKSFYWHGAIHHQNGCITEMTAWATYGLIGHVLVTTYNYYVVQICGSATPTITSWSSVNRQSTDQEMIIELRKIYTDHEVEEILMIIK